MDRKFNPLVSIIIPVYNGANFMREAIDSAIKQTYDNIEIIVINDGSSDAGETERIALSYGARIRYFSKENGGCASALNLGIENMRGDYFSWLSHDDVYLPDKILRQIEVLDGLQNKETILFSGYHLINVTTTRTGTVRPDEALTVTQLQTSLLPLMRGLIHGCTLLIPRVYFEKIGLFDVGLPSTQDYALWFKIFRTAPLHFDTEINVQSRVHPDQGTHKIEKHVEECNVLWSGFLRELTKDEMVAMGGTKYTFLKQQASFLAKTPYREAAQLAAEMAENEKANIKISVVVPFFNRVTWTIEAVNSVLNQTHKNVEILLVDDGSTEELSDLKELIKKDHRILYLRQENSGPAKARNLGIDHATGDFVAFLDSDDLFFPNKLKTQLDNMLESGAFFCHTSYQRIDPEGKPLETISSAAVSENIFPRIIASCPIAMPTVMARTELMKENRFLEHLEIAEDVCLWIKIASRYEIAGIDVPLSKVRVGPSTASLNKSKQAMGYLNIASFVINDPYLSKFEPELRLLITDFANIFNSHHALVHNTSMPLSDGRDSAHGFLALIKAGMISIKTRGFRTTLRRVRLFLGY